VCFSIFRENSLNETVDIILKMVQIYSILYLNYLDLSKQKPLSLAGLIKRVELKIQINR